MRRDKVEDVDEEDEGPNVMRYATKQNKKNYFYCV